MGAVTSLAFSESGWLLVSAGRDSVMNLWNLRNNSHIKTVPAFEVRAAPLRPAYVFERCALGCRPTAESLFPGEVGGVGLSISL